MFAEGFAMMCWRGAGRLRCSESIEEDVNDGASTVPVQAGSRKSVVRLDDPKMRSLHVTNT